MLHIILDSGNYALIDQKHGSPLKCALDDNCFECINIMSSDKYKFDYQMVDAQGISFIGYLIQKMMDTTDEQSEEFRKLDELCKEVFGKIDLDMHKE
jgi:hypothetical protein